MASIVMLITVQSQQGIVIRSMMHGSLRIANAVYISTCRDRKQRPVSLGQQPKMRRLQSTRLRKLQLAAAIPGELGAVARAGADHVGARVTSRIRFGPSTSAGPESPYSFSSTSLTLGFRAALSAQTSTTRCFSPPVVLVGGDIHRARAAARDHDFLFARRAGGWKAAFHSKSETTILPLDPAVTDR
jgi:hypothetical protein